MVPARLYSAKDVKKLGIKTQMIDGVESLGWS